MPSFGAFIPLLLFIFPGASSHCHTSTENECDKHTAFVPRHSLAGEGIDVTTMARKGAYLVDSSLWQHEDGTCTLCQNPLQGGQWQRLPLAVVDWRVHVSCGRKLSDSVQQSAMGMMESAASVVQNDWKVGLDVPVKPKVNVQVALAGSHSKLAKTQPRPGRQPGLRAEIFLSRNIPEAAAVQTWQHQMLGLMQTMRNPRK
ncbi:hypothetical protein KIL84_007539 [Mauremys mutica]|uniref:Uncharacterized protein n=1 Tax=Mauremys mutica TaxID=74926 RepID=A0A9D3X228_9SAUR|nr:hypothetical protein KIL84_007539 [Mauremys mutica]